MSLFRECLQYRGKINYFQRVNIKILMTHIVAANYEVFNGIIFQIWEFAAAGRRTWVYSAAFQHLHEISLKARFTYTHWTLSYFTLVTTDFLRSHLGRKKKKKGEKIKGGLSWNKKGRNLRKDQTIKLHNEETSLAEDHSENKDEGWGGDQLLSK